MCDNVLRMVVVVQRCSFITDQFSDLNTTDDAVDNGLIVLTPTAGVTDYAIMKAIVRIT